MTSVNIQLMMYIDYIWALLKVKVPLFSLVIFFFTSLLQLSNLFLLSWQPLYYLKIHQPCNSLPSQSHLLAWDWLICLLAKASLLFLSIPPWCRKTFYLVCWWLQPVSYVLYSHDCFLLFLSWFFMFIPHGLTHFNRFFCVSKERLVNEWQSITVLLF